MPGVGAGEDGEPGHRVADVVLEVARGGRVDRGRGRGALPAVGVVRDQLAGAVAGGRAVPGDVEHAQLVVDAPALPGIGIGVVGAHVDYLAGAQVVRIGADVDGLEHDARVQRAAPAVGVAGYEFGGVVADVRAVAGEVRHAQVMRGSRRSVN